MSRIEIELCKVLKKKSEFTLLEEFYDKHFLWNGAELLERSDFIYQGLKTNGVTPGDRVILIANTSMLSITSLIGALMAKSTIVLLDPHLPENELNNLIIKSDAKALIYESEEPPAICSTIDLLLFDLNGQLHDSSSKNVSDKSFKDKDQTIAFIIYTSGTTGASRGVMLGHNEVLGGIKSIGEVVKINKNERNLCMLPIYHVFGLVQNILTGLLKGICTGVVNAGSLEKTITSMKYFKPTGISAVPLQLRHLFNMIKSQGGLSNPEKIHEITGGKLSRIFTGGTALDPSISQGLQKLNINVIEGYGMTETTGAISIVDNNIGKSLSGVDFRIHNADSSGCGEICISGETLFRGYFRDEESTREVMLGPWLYTGDLGTVDNKGQLHLRGRLKELIITEGGKNSTPEEVEKQYLNIPGITEFSVFSLPTVHGDRIHAAVIPENKDISHEEIQNIFHKRGSNLPGHYRIEKIHLLDKLPKNRSDKVKRHKLQAQFKNFQTKETPTKNAAKNINEIVEEIVKITAALTQRNDIDQNKTFSENGIDSLLSISLAIKLQEKFGKEIPAEDFWSYPTPTELANYLSDNTNEAPKLVQASKNNEEDIAIVGVSCRFPGADNPKEFWKLLNSQTNPVQTMPIERQELLKTSGDYKAAYLKNIAQFDPLFFNISPLEAEYMDPQHRLWLELCWEAMAHAGIKPEQLSGTETAVFAGCGNSGYSKLFADHDLHPCMPTGISASALSGRLAYLLNLIGPCETIDTACSSSLISIHRACNSLKSGECTTAIAGGVNLLLDTDQWECLDKAGMLAPDGKCKVFDQSANGYVRGEGGGALILQRLSDAQKENRRILGVIRGSAVNQDGASNGFTAPSGRAQEILFRKTLEKANLTNDQIDYLECHGTGTKLGDSIEVNSIHKVYGKSREEKPLIIGSVKSQIGHLEAAAGVAGFIKSLLSISQGEIPANLHFKEANPLFKLNGSQVADKNIKLEQANGNKSRAAISSFGFTGSNCQVILEARSQKDILTPLLDYPVFNRQTCWISKTEEKEIALQDNPQETVCTIIESCLQLEPGSIDNETPLYEYGIDSINIVDIVLELEKTFKRKLQVEQLYDHVENVSDIVYWLDKADKVEEHTKNQPTPKTESPVVIKGQPAILPVTMPENDESLNDQQQSFFEEFSKEYIKRTHKSKQKTSENRLFLADQRSVSGFHKWKKEIIYPIHVKSATEGQVTDIDGNSYVDITMGFGVNFFGHNPDFIQNAVNEYLKSPLPLAAQNSLSGEVAKKFTQLTGKDRVTFLCTGSEAVMSALRVARIATGRQRIAMFRWSYHGCHDQVLPHPNSNGQAALISGVNPGSLQDVLILDYDSPESLERLKKEASSLAAILVEPVQSRRPDIQPESFLKELRTICTEAKSALIFDEVITGFRSHPGGAGAYFDIDADISIYGKIIGGGYPLAAIAGKNSFMNHVDGGDWQYGDNSYPQIPQTFVGGTYNSHPIAMAAANAVLDKLITEGGTLQSELNNRTEEFVGRMNNFFQKEKLPLKIEQFSSLFRFICKGQYTTDLFYACLRHLGIYATEVRNCFLSTAHSDIDIERIEEAVKKASFILKKGGFMQESSYQQQKPLPSKDTGSPLIKLGGSETPKYRLFCLPYAGGNSGLYRQWIKHLPPEIEVFYLQLPDRNSLKHSSESEFESLMNILCPALKNKLDIPWAVFGHSMGAIIAYEIARRLKNDHLQHLFVSGENPPNLVIPDIEPSMLNDESLTQWMAKLGITLPKNHASLILPKLRDDLSLFATYLHKPEPLLDIPMTVFGSDKDPLVPLKNLQGWKVSTTSQCNVHQMEGDHFFIEKKYKDVLETITGELEVYS